LTTVTELTVTPPLTETAMCLAKPGPGSKKPAPPLEPPVIVRVVEMAPSGTLVGDAPDGVAGGGAMS